MGGHGQVKESCSCSITSAMDRDRAMLMPPVSGRFPSFQSMTCMSSSAASTCSCPVELGSILTEMDGGNDVEPAPEPARMNQRLEHASPAGSHPFGVQVWLGHSLALGESQAWASVWVAGGFWLGVKITWEIPSSCTEG
jgi:hypothetical protein